jgi:hypothetical protein
MCTYSKLGSRRVWDAETIGHLVVRRLGLGIDPTSPGGGESSYVTFGQPSSHAKFTVNPSAPITTSNRACKRPISPIVGFTLSSFEIFVCTPELTTSAGFPASSSEEFDPHR